MEIQKLLQIGIIVRSVDKAVEYYHSVLGIDGPWDISEVSGEVPPFDDLVIDGVPRKEKICKLAICKAFGMEIELIEPIADSPYSRWLEEHGPGLHHIAITSKDSYEKILEDNKDRIWIRATGIGGLMDYTYVDYREEMGLIMECYKNLAPGKTGWDKDNPGDPVE